MARINKVDRRFIFSGSAVAFAAHIRRPDDVFVKAASASHLPITGGLSESVIEGIDTPPFEYKDIIKFSSSRSFAKGDFSDPRRAMEFTHGNHGDNDLPTNTAVSARLDNLTVNAAEDATEQTPQRVFGAGLLDIHMEATSNRRGSISFRSLSATYKSVTLTTSEKESSSTAELIVHTATGIFEENDTKEKLLKTYASDADFRKKYAACFRPSGPDTRGLWARLFEGHKIPYADQGPFVATFVTKLEWQGKPPEGTEIVDNRLTISGLGRIYFGEVVVDENSRRATLLRFELGSGTGGDASACEAATNGIPWPPSKKGTK